jgi:hypothetical protein
MKLTDIELRELKYLLAQSALGILPSTDRGNLISLIKKEMPEADTSTPKAQEKFGYRIVGRIYRERSEEYQPTIIPMA